MDTTVVIKPKKVKIKNGFTIVEVTVAITVLIIAILGTSAFQYHSALSARRADLYTTSARAALLLCEGWTGTGGNINFAPVSMFAPDVNIVESVGPTKPTDFTKLGSYKIRLEGCDYFATMSWKNLNADLRALNVIVSWDQFGKGKSGFANANKSYRLTTYVENPN
jgi:type II secretory pathway pseudopilin PulG